MDALRHDPNRRDPAPEARRSPRAFVSVGRARAVGGRRAARDVEARRRRPRGSADSEWRGTVSPRKLPDSEPRGEGAGTGAGTKAGVEPWNFNRGVKLRPISPQARARFLEGLAEGLTVTAAATKGGRNPRRFYELRHESEEFAKAWEEALERGTQVLEEELRR